MASMFFIRVFSTGMVKSSRTASWSLTSTTLLPATENLDSVMPFRKDWTVLSFCPR